MYKIIKPIPAGGPPKRSLSSEKALFIVRMREWDREFARQTKQLTALTKQLGKRITKRSSD